MFVGSKGRLKTNGQMDKSDRITLPAKAVGDIQYVKSCDTLQS